MRGAIIACFALAGCAASAPSTEPKLIGWRLASTSAMASGPELQQNVLICRDYAAARANMAAPTGIIVATINVALTGCMAQRGYLPIYDR